LILIFLIGGRERMPKGVAIILGHVILVAVVGDILSGILSSFLPHASYFYSPLRRSVRALQIFAEFGSPGSSHKCCQNQTRIS
jgi:hypothetical protein